MNNIQQFLEEEKREFAEKVTSIALTDYLIKSETRMDEAIKDHDTRLINFILGEVKREVEKKLQSNEFWKQTFPQEYVEGYRIATDDISTIINNLRVK